MTNRKFGAITSSTNPEEIATRVKGAILALSSLVVFVGANVLGINLTAADVVDLATQLGTVAGAVWAIYGAGLWILAKIFHREE